MTKVVFVHGMFQIPKSWHHWVRLFKDKGYDCSAPAWPLHEGEAAALRQNPPAGLGELSLDEIYAKTFHGSFANTMTVEQGASAFVATTTHDSRNVLRDCMGSSGKVDLSRTHAPLLLVAGEKDEIIPADLCEKNFKAYQDRSSVTAFKEFAGRSHFICREPGSEEVASFVADSLQQSFPASALEAGRPAPETPSTIIV